MFDTLLSALQSMRLLLPSVAPAGIAPFPLDEPPSPVPDPVLGAAPATVTDAAPESVPVALAGLPPPSSLVLVAVIPEIDRVVVDSSKGSLLDGRHQQ